MEGRFHRRGAPDGAVPPARWVCRGGRVRARSRRRTGKEAGPRLRALPERAHRRRRGSQVRCRNRTPGACVATGLVREGRDEHGAVTGELLVRLLAERDGGAHLRLLHHHRLQRQECPGAAARLADHAVSAAEARANGAGHLDPAWRGPKPGRGAGDAGRTPAPSPGSPPEQPFTPKADVRGGLAGSPGFPGFPSKLAPLRRKFPGLLLNFNFELLGSVPPLPSCSSLPSPTPGQ